MAFPNDFPIFSFPSRPFILFSFDNTASGSFNTSPYILLNFLTISLHCSINGNWSSPTGMIVPSITVISAAWLTGYPKNPYVTLSPNKSLFCAISVFTVGFLSSLAIVTKFE